MTTVTQPNPQVAPALSDDDALDAEAYAFVAEIAPERAMALFGPSLPAAHAAWEAIAEEFILGDLTQM